MAFVLSCSKALDTYVPALNTFSRKAHLQLIPDVTMDEFWLPLKCFDISKDAKNGCPVVQSLDEFVYNYHALVLKYVLTICITLIRFSFESAIQHSLSRVPEAGLSMLDGKHSVQVSTSRWLPHGRRPLSWIHRRADQGFDHDRNSALLQRT